MVGQIRPSLISRSCNQFKSWRIYLGIGLISLSTSVCGVCISIGVVSNLVPKAAGWGRFGHSGACVRFTASILLQFHWGLRGNFPGISTGDHYKVSHTCMAQNCFKRLSRKIRFPRSHFCTCPWVSTSRVHTDQLYHYNS